MQREPLTESLLNRGFYLRIPGQREKGGIYNEKNVSIDTCRGDGSIHACYGGNKPDGGFLQHGVAFVCSNSICCYSGKILERFTHNEAPWLAARGDLPVTAPSDRIIGKSLIGEYFSAVKAKYNMVNPGDIKEYAQDMFLCR